MDREILLSTLEKASANALDVYFDLYTKYFEEGEAPEEALEVILEYPQDIGDIKDKNPKAINWQDENKMTFIFEDLICGMASRIAEMNDTKKEFYKKLYNAIFCSDSEFMPQSKEEKVIALKILSEKAVAVPYFQIQEIEKVSEEEFEKAMAILQPQVQEAFCMLQRQFATPFELVAQLLRISDGISDRREQIMFWALIMDKFYKRDRD